MLSSLFGYAIPMIISLVTTPIVLNELGVSAYGLISLVSVIIGYLTVMDMGLDLPITKYLAEDQAKADTKAGNLMLNNTLQLYFIIGIIGMLVIIFTSKLFAFHVFEVPEELLDEAVVVFQLAGVGFFGSVITSWGRAISMGLQRFEITYGISILTNIVGICLGLYMIFIGYGVVGFVFMRIVSSLFSGIAYWIFAQKTLPYFHFQFGFDKSTLLRVRGYIGYGAINRLVSGLVNGLDKTLIAAWLGVAASGIYSLPFMLTSSLGYMISYMLGFTLPMASELESTGQLDKLRKIYIKSTRFIAGLSSMIFIPVIIFGDIFITLWIGPEIGEKTKYIIILLASSAFLSTLFSSLPNNIAVGTGKIKQFTVYATIRSIILALGLLMMIKPLDIEGAGFAFLIANIADFFFLIFVIKYYLKISPNKIFKSAYLTPIVIGIIIAFFLQFLRPITDSWIVLILLIGLYELLYIFIGFKAGVFGDTEKKIILNFVKKIK